MLGGAMYTTIKTLMEKGMNKSQIVRATGHDWKTVAKVVKGIKMGKEWPKKKPHPKILDPYKEKIVQLMELQIDRSEDTSRVTKDGIKSRLLNNQRLSERYSKERKYLCQNTHQTRRRGSGRLWICWSDKRQ